MRPLKVTADQLPKLALRGVMLACRNMGVRYDDEYESIALLTALSAWDKYDRKKTKHTHEQFIMWAVARRIKTNILRERERRKKCPTFTDIQVSEYERFDTSEKGYAREIVRRATGQLKPKSTRLLAPVLLSIQAKSGCKSGIIAPGVRAVLQSDRTVREHYGEGKRERDTSKRQKESDDGHTTEGSGGAKNVRETTRDVRADNNRKDKRPRKPGR